MKRLFKLVLVLTLSLSILVSCQKRSLDLGYTVYPVQYLLERIGKDYVNTINLSNGENVMRATLVDDYKEILKSADTIFTIGGLEPYVDTISKDIADYTPDVFDLASKGAVLPFQRYTMANIDGVDVMVESNYYENPLFENVDTYTNDPYLWLDPIMMTSMANQVLNYFIEVDPDNTSYYQKNFDEVKMELAYLDANYAELRNINLPLASMIPAFTNFSANYNMSISPIILSKYGNLPTNAQLEIIKSRLINDGVRHLIVEEDLDKDIMDLANTLKEELDLELVYVSSLSSRSKKDIENNVDYISIMNENLQVLKSLSMSNEIEITE